MVFSKILYFFLFPAVLFPSCHQGMTMAAHPLKPIFVCVADPLNPESPQSREKGFVTTAEAAVGGLYRSFCELGTNDQERI